MLDAVQAGARRIHPAGKDPLHLALQRDLVDLDKGVGVGGLGRRPRVAGVGLDPQRAELDGLADILVEIDDAPGDLVEAGEARLLVDDLLRRRLGRPPRRRAAAWPASAARPWAALAAGAVPAAALATPGWPGCGGATAMPGWVFCGMTVVPGGGASGCDCTDPGGGTPCPGGGRLGVGSRRPRGSSGTSSSSSGVLLLPGCRAESRPGGRGAGSEKILPICACAGGASEIVVAATRAAKPVRAMVRNISRL